MRTAFIGKITFFCYPPSPAPCPFGGKAIPMLATIYRQSAVWGFNIGRRAAATAAERALNFLFYNAAPHTSITMETDLQNFTEAYYLTWVPWFKLQSRNIDSFHRDGERTESGMERNSHLDPDWTNTAHAL